jgi:hypothetical protein
MNVRNYVRTLVVAVLLAATIVTASTVQVHAMRPWHNTKSTCQADGYAWDEARGCADEYCNDGLMGYGEPGETQVFQNHIYMCDGFSGQWTQVGRTQTNPVLPGLQIVGGSVAVQVGASSPIAPLPVGGTFAK